MAKVIRNKVIEKLKKLYPKTGFIEIAYSGSGDSFDGFYETKAYLSIKKNKMLEEFSNERAKSPEESQILSDLKDENTFLSTVVFDAFEKHSEIDFNNEGCQGCVYVDIDNNKIWIDNYYTETINSDEFIYYGDELMEDEKTD